MILFGYTLESLFLYSLFISGGLTLLYILFGEILEGMFDFIDNAAGNFLNPTLILSFLTIFSGLGYILEGFTPLHSGIVIGISGFVSLILVTLLNVFVLIPLSSAEESIGYTDEELKGRIGKVTTPISENEFGHVMLEGKLGNISRRSKSFDNEKLPYGTKVVVVDVKNGVLYVSKHSIDFE